MVAAPVAVGIGVLSDEDLRAAQEVYSDVAAALGAVDDFVAEGQLAAALHLIQALAETNQTAVLSRYAISSAVQVAWKLEGILTRVFSLWPVARVQ